jgi:hypothetical protein
VGDHLTFLFENADTVRYQVQEMMLTERLVKEAEIAHELVTYNELLGKKGELGGIATWRYVDRAHVEAMPQNHMSATQRPSRGRSSKLSRPSKWSMGR